MMRTAPVPVHRLLMALEPLAYWTSPPPKRCLAVAPLLPLEQMYGYWRPD